MYWSWNKMCLLCFESPAFYFQWPVRTSGRTRYFLYLALFQPCPSWLSTMWFCKLWWKDWIHVPEKGFLLKGACVPLKIFFFCVYSASTEVWTTLEFLSRSDHGIWTFFFLFPSLVQSRMLSFVLKKSKSYRFLDTCIHSVTITFSDQGPVLPLENNKVLPHKESCVFKLPFAFVLQCWKKGWSDLFFLNLSN